MDEIKRQEVIKKLQQFIAPDDVIAAMLCFFEREEIPVDIAKIHKAVLEIKKRYPEMLKEFSFSENDVFLYSRLLERVLFRLHYTGLIKTVSPDFRLAIIDNGAKKFIRENILTLFDEVQQRKIKEMGKLFEQLLITKI